MRAGEQPDWHVRDRQSHLITHDERPRVVEIGGTEIVRHFADDATRVGQRLLQVGGVNAFVVKPVEFKQFFKAIQDLGVFWALLNEPPPGYRAKDGG